MKMKSIVIHILILSFVMSSCTNSFLEIYPETSLNEGNFYQTDNELVDLVNGCYVPLRDLEKWDHWVMAELKSDNLDQQFSAIAGNFETSYMDNLQTEAASITVQSFWNRCYQGVYRCNKAISVFEDRQKDWGNLNLQNRSLGEAYFLRALYYFYLVRQYGGVPLVIKQISGEEAVMTKRSSESEIYNQIIKDLIESQKLLSQAVSVEQKGRVNEGAALGLLGKVYLTTGDNNLAVTVLEQLVNLGKYELLKEYEALFDPTNKDYLETIFSVQYSESSGELSNDFIFFNVPNTSKGEVTNRPNITLRIAGSMEPSKELISAFEENDKRKDVAIKYWEGIGWDDNVHTFAYCAKYKPPQFSPQNYCGDNFPILRYADVLLMLGEAYNNLGDSKKASEYIYKVRERAGLKDDISLLSQEELNQLIDEERQVEFCFENQRWYDLVRRGKAVEVMRAQGKPMEEFKIIQPIPSEEIFINKLDQNPGY